ncbi:MAG: response regulator, partial [Actinomycetota bacterium]
MIVDDETESRNSLGPSLEEGGHHCKLAHSSKVAMSLLATEELDLIILDLRMPGESDVELIKSISADFPETAILISSEIASLEAAREAFQAGALGFLVKPFSKGELNINVLNTLRLKTLETERNQLVAELRRKIVRTGRLMKTAVADLENSHSVKSTTEHEVAKRLSLALSLKNDETDVHIDRMSRFCRMLAERSGVPDDQLDDLQVAATLHDVGKIGIPDAVLLKPSILDLSERRVVEKHAELGFVLLSHGQSPLLKLAATIAHAHHENWDGSGYPQGLQGKEIPKMAQIAALADSFDSFTSPRVYRPAFSIEEAEEIIRRDSETKFDPKMVEIFLDALPELESVKLASPDQVDERIRVLSISDDPDFLEKMTGVIEMKQDLVLVGWLGTVATARLEAPHAHPDVVFVDFLLPHDGGLGLIPWLVTEMPDSSIIMVAETSDFDLILRSIEAGTAGFIEKGATADVIVDAITRAFEGELLLSPEEVRSVVSEAARKRRPGTSDLSEREVEVLGLTAQGLSSRDIAD